MSSCFCFLYFCKILNKMGHCAQFIEEKTHHIRIFGSQCLSKTIHSFIKYLLSLLYIFFHTQICPLSKMCFLLPIFTATIFLSHHQLLQKHCSGLVTSFPILILAPTFISQSDLLKSVNPIMQLPWVNLFIDFLLLSHSSRDSLPRPTKPSCSSCSFLSLASFKPFAPLAILDGLPFASGFTLPVSLLTLFSLTLCLADSQFPLINLIIILKNNLIMF